MKRIEPPVTDVSEPFWNATRDQRFLLQWCRSCGQPIFYPREVCPRCLGTDLEWKPASGDGRVHAVSVQYPPSGDDPYAVALIDLAEGVRVMSNVIECAPDHVAVGMAVSVAWEPLSDGRNLPQFRPTSS